MNRNQPKCFRDYPAHRLIAWLEAISWRPPSRRAWRAFTSWAFGEFGDFAELTRDGGFSGAPKLAAAVAALSRLREAGELDRVATVGDCLDLARREGWALGFLPCVDHVCKISRLAGRPDLAQRMAALGFRD